MAVPDDIQVEANMAFLGVILIGLVVGLLARLVKPGRNKMGWIMTIVLGVGGSVLATWGGQQLGLYKPGEAAGFIGAVVGAVVLLALLEMLRK